MEEKKKVIPLTLPKYTLGDLSVIVPQASQYVKRIKWFLEQYVAGTPPEVIKNTWLVWDPEDEETSRVWHEYAAKYNMKGLTTKPPHSTYKMQAGFGEVKTRLCVRMHNDCHIVRNDWAHALIDHFNEDNFSQLIGYWHPSGDLSKEFIDRFFEQYPSFDEIYNQLEFSEGERPIVGANFLGASFMAAQTYVFRGIYPLVVDFNNGNMSKEDVIIVLFAAIFGINIITWRNVGDFVRNVGAKYGDFEEDMNPPKKPEMYIQFDKRDQYTKAVFGKVE